MTQQLGKYQLIRKLATGGMAEVFLAKAAGPMGFEKTLVLKRILPHLAEDPAFVEMFLGEAKLAAQLNHPNIIQIFDFGEADGDYFLAMEYIDGPNLRVLLKRAQAAEVPLPAAVCARLIASACEGLAFAHDFVDPETGQPLGLIHRDISPDNILVSRQGAVKVVDFGIAKAAGQSHKTQTGLVKGKLAYMPPEQVRAKALDRRVDVYALGVVLYELVTGHKPFEAETDASLMQAILFEPLVPAVQHMPDMPEPLQRILDRALNKDREQRYPDCLALAADLEEFILSTGKRVTTQQIVQLIAQVAPNTESPVPTPHSGTARGKSKSSATPAHTPPPSGTGAGVGTGPGTRSAQRSGHVSRTGNMAAPMDSPPEEPHAKTVALQTGEVSAKKEPEPAQDPSPPPSRSSKRWLPAAVGAVLLAAGGGFVLLRTSSEPAPVTPPPVAQPTPPATTTPPSEPVVAKPSEQPTPTPTPEQPTSKPPEGQETAASGPPAQDTPPAKADEPVKVAEVSPKPDPGTPPRTEPKPRPRPKPPPAQPVGKGTLSFRVRPFATVFVDGKNLGQTPFPPVEFPAGKHTVRFVNDDLKKNVVQTVELKASETKVIKLNLEE